MRGETTISDESTKMRKRRLLHFECTKSTKSTQLIVFRILGILLLWCNPTGSQDVTIAAGVTSLVCPSSAPSFNTDCTAYGESFSCGYSWMEQCVGYVNEFQGSTEFAECIYGVWVQKIIDPLFFIIGCGDLIAGRDVTEAPEDDEVDVVVDHGTDTVNCFSTVNAVYGGDVLAKYPAMTSSEACCDLCSETTGCQHWSFRITSPYCYLFSTVDSLDDSLRWESDFIGCSNSPGLFIGTYAQTDLFVQTYDDCCEECNFATDCIRISFRNDGLCRLFTDIKDYTADEQDWSSDYTCEATTGRYTGTYYELTVNSLDECCLKRHNDLSVEHLSYKESGECRLFIETNGITDDQTDSLWTRDTLSATATSIPGFYYGTLIASVKTASFFNCHGNCFLKDSACEGVTYYPLDGDENDCRLYSSIDGFVGNDMWESDEGSWYGTTAATQTECPGPEPCPEPESCIVPTTFSTTVAPLSGVYWTGTFDTEIEIMTFDECSALCSSEGDKCIHISWKYNGYCRKYSAITGIGESAHWDSDQGATADDIKDAASGSFESSSTSFVDTSDGTPNIFGSSDGIADPFGSSVDSLGDVKSFDGADSSSTSDGASNSFVGTADGAPNTFGSPGDSFGGIKSFDGADSSSTSDGASNSFVGAADDAPNTFGSPGDSFGVIKSFEGSSSSTSDATSSSFGESDGASGSFISSDTTFESSGSSFDGGSDSHSFGSSDSVFGRSFDSTRENVAGSSDGLKETDGFSSSSLVAIGALWTAVSFGAGGVVVLVLLKRRRGYDTVPTRNP